MWWLWPHLRRLWATAGTVSAGLAVNYLYGWLGNQPAPALSRLTDYLWRYRYFSLSALLAFAVASAFAERQFRKHEARAPATTADAKWSDSDAALEVQASDPALCARCAGTVRCPRYGWMGDRIGAA